MRMISTPNASPAGGHYAQGVVANGMVYVSGMLPILPSGEKVTGEIEAQTRAAIANLKTVLEAAGSSLDRVVKTTVYVSDIALWSRVNSVYAECFGTHTPARAVVPTRDLHYGLLIEIDAIALAEPNGSAPG